MKLKILLIIFILFVFLFGCRTFEKVVCELNNEDSIKYHKDLSSYAVCELTKADLSFIKSNIKKILKNSSNLNADLKNERKNNLLKLGEYQKNQYFAFKTTSYKTLDELGISYKLRIETNKGEEIKGTQLFEQIVWYDRSIISYSILKTDTPINFNQYSSDLPVKLVVKFPNDNKQIYRIYP